MKSTVITIANYFIELAKKEGFKLRQFGLMKRVYITYGFYLALYNQSILQEDECVEAWVNGPVIPTVYYAFKHNKAGNIHEISELGHNQIEDNRLKLVADMVWKRYHNMSDEELVNLLHRDGTPWAYSYKKQKNNKISDIYTKAYYRKVINDILSKKNNNESKANY